MTAPLDLDGLEKLCKEATPGPWFVDTCNQGDACWCRVVGNKQGDDSLEHCVVPSGSCRTNDCEYFAAANPATVLALIARVREAEKDNEDLRNSLHNRRALVVQRNNLLARIDHLEHEIDCKQASLVAENHFNTEVVLERDLLKEKLFVAEEALEFYRDIHPEAGYNNVARQALVEIRSKK